MAGRSFEFAFDNSYARSLEGLYVPWQGSAFPLPRIVKLNEALAKELGLDPDVLNSPEGAAVLAGSASLEGSEPLAMVYAGHQFGGFSPQLGDGRALLIGEIIDSKGNRRDIHLKGSGPTPFSRNGDGKATLGPVLREYVVGEAMHALGVPTTRALAAVLTGEKVIRERILPGAVLARIASSHLRVGTFQFFAARGDVEKTRRLADYAISRHYPDLAGSPERYREFLGAVIDRQAHLVAKWMLVGFVHGVMNTDNLTISGETIDYGPCAFMDNYDPNTVFSSIDSLGRYAYGNQPEMAQWGLTRFAESLLPLIDPDNSDEAIRLASLELNKFSELYNEYWLIGMRSKLGLTKSEANDVSLINDLYSAIDGNNVDFTGLFRGLADVIEGHDALVLSLFDDPSSMAEWLERWRTRLLSERVSAGERKRAMNATNPIYIPRNHLVEEALHEAVENDEMAPFNKLLEVLSRPFEKRDGLERYVHASPPATEPFRTFCGT